MPREVPNSMASDERNGDDRRLLGIECACKVKIGDDWIEADIRGIELRQPIGDHHVLTLDVRELGEESTRDINNYAGMLGKPISLTIFSAGGVVAEERSLTFVGIVTRVNQSSKIHALNVTTIEAHSPTIAMDGPRHNAFFRDQKSSDIIGTLLRNYKITVGKVESAGSNMAFCVQHRETDYDFVMRLAAGVGLFAHYDGQEFRAIKPSSSGAEELIWRETLGSFAMGLGTAPQEFTSQVYNYEQSKSYEQDTKSVRSTASLSSLSQTSPEGSKKIYRDSGFSTGPKVVSDARSLDDTLLTEKNRSMGQMITCTGQSTVPAVKVGHCVQIKGLEHLEGHYLIDSVTHVVDLTEGYYNTFVCRPLDIAFPAGRSAAPSATHLQSATVVDNVDPEKMGRVKVKFPWLEAEETPWIRLVTPHAGQDRGWYAIPEIGDEVLIGYEFGSPQYPIALGTLYNKDAAPPASAGDPDNNFKLFRTRSGNQIELKDEDGSEAISITTKDGDNKIVLDMSGPGISIESKGDISIKGKNISLEGDEEIKVKAGSNTDIEAGANLTTKASGQYNAEGATVTVKGNPINLN